MTAEVACSDHPDAPHGFNRNLSHSEDRYVCDCEGWEPEPPTYRACLERSYPQRARMLIAFNKAAGDLDDKLQAAWAAGLDSSPDFPRK